MDERRKELLNPPTPALGADQDDVEAREDARLLRAIAGEDQGALALLYRRRGGLVFSFLVRMLGNEAEAQEVLQDTFIRLWRRAGDFNPERSSATAWLLLFARGLALDKLRARSRHAEKISAYETEATALETFAVPASEHMERDELSAVCRDALERLPSEQSRALQLAFYRGWTHEEIAQAQNEPLGTVKARIRRGLQSLRKMLRDYHG